MALALMFSASAGALAVTAPAPAMAQGSDVDRFFNSSYNYCDAKMVGAFYNRDAYYGKTVIGAKLRNGIGQNIGYILRTSRNRGNRCTFQDVDSSYDDAVVLGRYWNVSTGQAKSKIANYFTRGQARTVSGALNTAKRQQVNERRAISSFGRSGFSYCDAKLVGAVMSPSLGGNTAYRGKVAIGNMVLSGNVRSVIGSLDRARQRGTSCNWGDTGYNYNDAQRLARLWKTNTSNAKGLIADMVTQGRSDVIDGALGR